MLAALEQGVKGGVWFNLIDKVYSLPNLRAAFARVKGNGGATGLPYPYPALQEARRKCHGPGDSGLGISCLTKIDPSVAFRSLGRAACLIR